MKQFRKYTNLVMHREVRQLCFKRETLDKKSLESKSCVRRNWEHCVKTIFLKQI